jgi:hypothetical protein
MKSILTNEAAVRIGVGRVRRESGQVAFIFIIASLGVAVLIAFLLNTARLTIRKVEAQGSADSAAVTGAGWMARGMNLMVLNNNGMADLLAVVIDVHSARQAAIAMEILLPPIIGALLRAGQFVMAYQYESDLRFWTDLDTTLTPLDTYLVRTGWEMMRSLDQVNQRLKTDVPGWAKDESLRYARLNGGESVTLSSGHDDSTPIFPVGRIEYPLATEAKRTGLNQLLIHPTEAALHNMCYNVSAPCPSLSMALNAFRQAIGGNVAQLSGGTGYAPPGSSPLSWPVDPPMAMVFTDQPLANGDATIVDPDAEVDLLQVRKMLQFVAVSVSPMDPHSFVGAQRFANPSPVWRTYGQANVYNPSDWSMFDQNWRAKLARASLVNERGELVSAGAAGFPDPSFVNTH